MKPNPSYPDQYTSSLSNKLSHISNFIYRFYDGHFVCTRIFFASILVQSYVQYKIYLPSTSYVQNTVLDNEEDGPWVEKAAVLCWQLGQKADSSVIMVWRRNKSHLDREKSTEKLHKESSNQMALKHGWEPTIRDSRGSFRIEKATEHDSNKEQIVPQTWKI